MRRTTSRLLAVALGSLAAIAIVPPVEGLVAPHEARADVDAIDELAVGTELVAIADVRLHNAEIAKGSRVAVRKLDVHAGRLAAVDVELADGHVVPRVRMHLIRASFRVADDE